MEQIQTMSSILPSGYQQPINYNCYQAQSFQQQAQQPIQQTQVEIDAFCNFKALLFAYQNAQSPIDQNSVSLQIINFLQAIPNQVQILYQSLMKADNSQLICLCCQLLTQSFNTVTYLDFNRQCQDISTDAAKHGVKGLFEHLLQISFQSDNLQNSTKEFDVIHRTMVKFAINFWIENQCFQTYIQQIKSEFQNLSGQNQTDQEVIRKRQTILKIFKTFLEELKLITVFENSISEFQSEELTDLSQRNYQTVLLFKQTSLPDIFYVLQESFNQSRVVMQQSGGQILNDKEFFQTFKIITKILSYCLKLIITPIRKSINQIAIKIESFDQSQQVVKLFCNLSNIVELSALVIQLGNLNKDAADRLFHLIKLMVFSLDQADLEQTAAQQLVQAIVRMLESGVIQRHDVLKLLSRIDIHLPLIKLDQQSALQWLKLLCHHTQFNKDDILNAYLNSIETWQSIIRTLEKVDTQETDFIRLQLFTQFQIVQQNILDGLETNTAIFQLDSLEEILNQPSHLKIIIKSIIEINLCSAKLVFDYLQAQLQSLKNKQNQGVLTNSLINQLSWTYQTFGILLVAIVEKLDSACHQQLQSERAQTAILVADLILREFIFYQQLDFIPFPQLTNERISSRFRLSLQFALKEFAKCLLTQKMKYQLQGEFIQNLAHYMKLDNPNFILATLLQYCLTSISKNVDLITIKDIEANHVAQLSQEYNLKIIQYLTSAKPQSNRENQCLTIRNFQMDQSIIMDLINYLSNLILQQSPYQESPDLKMSIVFYQYLKLLNQLQGFYSGIFRAGQYRFLMNKLIEELRESLLIEVENVEQWVEKPDNLIQFSRRMLSFLKETSSDRDSRIQQDNSLYIQNVNYLNFGYLMVHKLIRVLAIINLDSPQSKEQGISILRKSIQTYINLGQNNFLLAKDLESLSLLREKIRELSKVIFEGLIKLVNPTQIMQYPEVFQKLVYGFISQQFERNIQSLIELTYENQGLSAFIMKVVQIGHMSTLNSIFQFSNICLEQLYSKFQMRERIIATWINQLIIKEQDSFKSLAKQIFLAILRGSKSGLQTKIEIYNYLVQIMNQPESKVKLGVKASRIFNQILKPNSDQPKAAQNIAQQ
ncbi:UNKNOWN [Stylonychia lemnae]|uniref:Uncharacterized protein n=1 Tax=Stylonychia lemnae TaxID=5949 RepID=A0A078AQ48_STYLE|nr:UNKNOWN [Stylonychia lemnae]|eukprot:CDW84294.1 UNKNOWN [Stylonychia lemnae]